MQRKESHGHGETCGAREINYAEPFLLRAVNIR
jgi:hypothetical protein